MRQRDALEAVAFPFLVSVLKPQLQMQLHDANGDVLKDANADGGVGCVVYVIDCCDGLTNVESLDSLLTTAVRLRGVVDGVDGGLNRLC